MVKPGAVVIDVGINRVDDADREERATASWATWTSTSASEVASLITPVPGGVGPMTIAMLLQEHGARGGAARDAARDAGA